jgi:hypothetical protein
MALPKKQKYFKFSIPKSLKVMFLQKRYSRGFRRKLITSNSLTQISNYFFKELELAFYMNMYFYATSLSCLLGVYSTGYNLMYKYAGFGSVLAGLRSLTYLNQILYVSSRFGVYFFYSLFPLNLEGLSITSSTKGGVGEYVLNRNSSSLGFKPNTKDTEEVKLSSIFFNSSVLGGNLLVDQDASGSSLLAKPRIINLSKASRFVGKGPGLIKTGVSFFTKLKNKITGAFNLIKAEKPLKQQS